MLSRAAALVLLASSLACSQTTIAPAGCANLPRTARTNPDEVPAQKKEGFKQRLKDQFSSGCANLLVTSCWGDEAAKAPDVPGTPGSNDPAGSPTTSPQQSSPQEPAKKSSDPLAFPEEQSREAEDAANGSSSSKKNSDPLAFPEEQSRRAEQAANAGVSSSLHPHQPSPPQAGEVEVIEMKPYNPHQAEKDVQVGDFYYKRGNYKAAVSRYDEALQLRPGSPSTTFKLADAYEKYKQLEKAALYYREYVRDYPDGKQIAEARAALDRLAPVVRANAAHLKEIEIKRGLEAGETLLAQKNYSDAVVRFCDVAGVAPDNPRNLFRLAQAQEATGDFPSAYHNYQSYLTLAPDGPFADAARREVARLRPQVQQSKASVPSSGTRP